MSGAHNPAARRSTGVLAGVLAAFILGAGHAGAQEFVAKYSTPTIHDPVHKGMILLKERVEARTKGRLRIDIYPASQLGAIPRVIEGTQLGTIEMATVPPEFLVGLNSRFGVVSAPGVFDDMMHGYRTMHDPEFKKAFWSLGRDKGIVVFSMQCNAETVYVSRDAIRKLGDFNGLKIRTFPSAMEREALKRLGATVAPMPLTEMVTALQQGAIDGAKSGAIVFTTFKMWTVAKNMLRTGDSLICPIHFASKTWWDKLPRDIRAAITEEAAEVDLINQKASVEVDRGASDIWRENGGQVFRLSEQDQAELRKRMRAVGPAATANDAGARKMYDLMLEAAERTRGKS